MRTLLQFMVETPSHAPHQPITMDISATEHRNHLQTQRFLKVNENKTNRVKNEINKTREIQSRFQTMQTKALAMQLRTREEQRDHLQQQVVRRNQVQQNFKSMDTTNASMANYKQNQQEIKQRIQRRVDRERRMSEKMFWQNNRHTLGKTAPLNRHFKTTAMTGRCQSASSPRIVPQPDIEQQLNKFNEKMNAAQCRLQSARATQREQRLQESAKRSARLSIDTDTDLV